MSKKAFSNRCILVVMMCIFKIAFAQHNHHAGHKHDASNGSVSFSGDLQVQPFVSHAIRLKEALEYIGSPLSAEDVSKLEAIRHSSYTEESIKKVQEILDPYCIALVDINPESRVKVERGNAAPQLMQGGWRSFLVKVNNEGRVTGKLEVESPNALLPYNLPGWGKNTSNPVSPGEAANRFLDAQMYTGGTMNKHLSGMPVEYTIVQLYSKDAGMRDVELGFNVGVSSKDIGFRNATNIMFHITPAVKLYFDIKDHDGKSVMAAITITDSIDRYPGKLSSVYPLPSRRVATFDEYPDFFFQQHVYRKTGEHVVLPPGKFTVKYTRGPEYLAQYQQIHIPENTDSVRVTLQLKRWIDVAKLGWHSADHHVHASGCSHYDSPAEGVNPADMWRQAAGEDLKVSSVLTWGPSWYHQKNNFTGKEHELSASGNIMQYDVEVSGFPSSHAGHLVLLRLKEDDYPGTTKIEEWPSWTGPVLQWAKGQNAVTGYAHSGDGLAPSYTENQRLSPSITAEEKVHAPAWRTYEETSTQIPNYIVPEMNGIGANEYIVTVTQGLVDFFSAGNTGLHRELNMWYHTLNAGIRIPISGETDFPCLSDERVGYARSYFKSSGPVNYNNYVNAIKNGRNYVSDGFSHIMNFSVNGVEPGVKNSTLSLKAKQKVTVKADVAAFLSATQERGGEVIANSHLDVFPCWNIERARIQKSRKVNVELIVNGEKIDAVSVEADGSVQTVQFMPEITEGSWVALRVYASAHTNPVYIDVKGQSVSVAKSLEWCVKAVDQCWKRKHPQIRAEERTAAEATYTDAKKWYLNKLNLLK